MMNLLTLEMIAIDPWNAIEQRLPVKADRALLAAAYSAARQCAAREYALMQSALEGSHIPEGWTGAAGEPDVHEENEARWFAASQRADFLRALFKECFAEPPEDVYR